ncbi:MAG: hypothetical protein U5J83_01510, partial [Bryobacterales bacterium]|nr:hypothetical protein [Bryobacterales bacterium]
DCCSSESLAVDSPVTPVGLVGVPAVQFWSAFLQPCDLRSAKYLRKEARPLWLLLFRDACDTARQAFKVSQQLAFRR